MWKNEVAGPRLCADGQSLSPLNRDAGGRSSEAAPPTIGRAKFESQNLKSPTNPQCSNQVGGIPSQLFEQKETKETKGKQHIFTLVSRIPRISRF